MQNSPLPATLVDGLGGSKLYIASATIAIIVRNNFQKGRTADMGRHIIFILFSRFLWNCRRANVWKVREPLRQKGRRRGYGYMGEAACYWQCK